MSEMTRSDRIVEGDFTLTPQQVNFFNDFGFLHIKRLFAAEIERIQAGFEEVYARETPQVIPEEDWLHYRENKEFQGVKRHYIGDFVERSPKLSWLLEDKRITGICRSLLGDSVHYKVSVGDRTNCNVNWHPDVYRAPIESLNVKFMFYLDSLDGSNGALRVIPGTHVWDETFAKTLQRTLLPANRGTYGLKPHEIPGFVIESEPGDLVINNVRTLHASFHGRPGRRLMTLSYGQDEE